MSRPGPAVDERSPGGAGPPVLGTVFSRPSLSKCIPIMLIVGTTLSIINQAGVILGGDSTWATWVRVALNFVVPFVVSSTGFYLGERAAWEARAAGGEAERPHWYGKPQG